MTLQVIRKPEAVAKKDPLNAVVVTGLKDDGLVSCVSESTVSFKFHLCI